MGLVFKYWQQNGSAYLLLLRGRRDRDRMVVGFTTTYAISAYHHYGVISTVHYVMRFVSDLRQVGGFLWVPRFPPSIKLTATIMAYYWNIVESDVKHHQTNKQNILYWCKRHRSTIYLKLHLKSFVNLLDDSSSRPQCNFVILFAS